MLDLQTQLSFSSLFTSFVFSCSIPVFCYKMPKPFQEFHRYLHFIGGELQQAKIVKALEIEGCGWGRRHPCTGARNIAAGRRRRGPDCFCGGFTFWRPHYVFSGWCVVSLSLSFQLFDELSKWVSGLKWAGRRNNVWLCYPCSYQGLGGIPLSVYLIDSWIHSYNRLWSGLLSHLWASELQHSFEVEYTVLNSIHTNLFFSFESSLGRSFTTLLYKLMKKEGSSDTIWHSYMFSL